MTKPTSTATSKTVDITTIKGLLDILGDNINSLKSDASDQNIKKTNAILQNVNAIKGIYNLAFTRERLANIQKINSDYEDYQQPNDLAGSVLGDNADRLKREHARAQHYGMEKFNRVMEKIRQELADNEDNQDADDDTYKYQEFSKDEVEVLNSVLCEAPDDHDFSTRYEKALYLLNNLKPSHFGVEE